METAANAKVFIMRTKYGYAVTPSPVVVRGAALDFENLTQATAKVSIPIPNTEPLKFDLEPNEKPRSVTLPDTGRVVSYTVDMGGGLFARGNSAPIIIRDA